MKTVNLSDVRIDGGTQGRVVIDQTLVYSYLENMKDGDIFPPMETVFDGTTHWLVDGFHRYHAYKLMDAKKVEISYKPGTLEEAQVRSFGVNGTHGKPRTNEDKRKVVQAALEHPLTCNKSTYEIAKICAVSQTFVSSMRDPKAKEKQAEQNKKQSDKKREEKQEEKSVTKQTSNQEVAQPNPNVDGEVPDESEIRAAEEALRADQEMMHKMLEADDALAVAVEENKRLNLRVAQLEARLRGLMNERNEAVDMIQKLQKQIAKSKK